jgi:acetoacetyl-CoA synthetase
MNQSPPCQPGEVLWQPHPDASRTTAMGRFMEWASARSGLLLRDYDDLWRYSVTSIEDFWQAVVEFFDVRFADAATAVLSDRSMPGAEWFPCATLNYADRALAGDPAQPVLESRSQTRDTVRLTRGQLRAEVAAVRGALKALGVAPGDRVAAYLPNIAEAVVCFLATAGLGAVFVSCAPELGLQAVIDRLGQLEPKVLVAVDGYRYGAKDVDRVEHVAALRAALPSVETTVIVPYLSEERAAAIPEAVPWRSLLSGQPCAETVPVPFAHPLYVLFSSGSTGLPKPIVHGHGGILVEHLKWIGLHCDLGTGDRMFSPSSTSWMAWNTSVSVLLCGGALTIFDGELAYPDVASFWTMLGDAGITHFGSSPPFLQICRREGVIPKAEADLSSLRVLTAGGSPMASDLYHWVYDAVADDIMVASISGGTDVCTAFVGGCPILPVRAGEITCRALGVKVEAFDEAGRSVVGVQGELVVTEPMPSMPVGFWGDPDLARYKAAYFDRFDGVWCHGDWITLSERGTAEITGRSDATLNRAGVRMGTQEFYTALDAVPEIQDSLVVHLEDPDDGRGDLLLFVALTPQTELDLRLEQAIREVLKAKLSPRHLPDRIIAVDTIPRTPTGKRLEVPVKRLLTGEISVETAARSAVDPAVLEQFGAHVRSKEPA